MDPWDKVMMFLMIIDFFLLFLTTPLFIGMFFFTVLTM